MGVLGIIALITWIIAAIGGFIMLGVWLRHGAARTAVATVGGGGATAGEAPAPETAHSHLPAGLVFAHFGLAVIGLIVWIIYLITSVMALGWIALVLVVIVAIAGFVMFFRWLPQRRAGAADAAMTPERHFPTAVVIAHGVFAAATVVLVIITAIVVSVG